MNQSMNRKKSIYYLTAYLFFLLNFISAPSAYCHHSFTAEFIAEKTLTFSGTITQVWFKNPHVRYLITIKHDGNEEIWDARGSPVVWLARKGWTRDSIKVGDKVTMHGFAGRDDRRMLSIINITLTDGTILVDKVPE